MTRRYKTWSDRPSDKGGSFEVQKDVPITAETRSAPAAPEASAGLGQGLMFAMAVAAGIPVANLRFMSAPSLP